MATILVIDDQISNRQLITTLLSYSGHRLLEAKDGAEGLQLAEREHPDLVITDLIMPRMDGYELVQQIRSRPAIARTPVIFYTAAYHEREARSIASVFGVRQIIVKPSEPESIIKIVNEALGAAGQSATSSSILNGEPQRLDLLRDKLYEKTAQLDVVSHRLSAIIDVARELASTRDSQQMLSTFALTARALLCSRFACAGILHSAGDVVEQWFWSGSTDSDSGPVQPPSPKARLICDVLSRPEPVAIAEVSEADLRDFPEGHPRLRSFLGASIASSTTAYGFIYFGDKLGMNAFSHGDILIAETLARLLGVSYENIKRLEEMTRYAQLLEHEMRERQNVEKQLFHSQKLEAVGRLAGGIAHDFNNLLTVILGYTYLLLDQFRSDDTTRQSVETIQVAANRAADLTAQLLAFSRKQVLQPRVLDLNAVVMGVESILRRVIGEDIHLVMILRPDLGRIKVDPGQIEQVIMNLAVNARDAMPRGGRLTLSTANVDLDEAYARQHVAVEPGPYVLLAVSDSGVGMDGETLKQIFEPFFTTKEQGKGTGLGLSTVYGIVKQSGGNVWVYSEPGQGTTFKIYLPSVAEPLQVIRKDKSIGERGGTETILLVEDDQMLRDLALETLRARGYDVLAAPNGEEALEICKRHSGQIHLFLTDVVMGGVSGQRLIEQAKALRPEMKILCMSGYTDEAITHHGILNENIPFLQKPFTPNGLSSKVRDVLDAQSDS